MVRQRLWLLPSTAQRSAWLGSPAFVHGCPQAGSPCCQTVLPAGLTPPRNGIDCLWQAAVLGRPAVSSICSSSIYVVLAVCQTPCHPSPAHYSTGCCSGLFLLVLTGANSHSSFLSKSSCLPLSFASPDLPFTVLFPFPEVLVPPAQRPACSDIACPLAGESIAPSISVTTSLSGPILVSPAQMSCVSSWSHRQYILIVTLPWMSSDFLYEQPYPAPIDPFSMSVNSHSQN